MTKHTLSALVAAGRLSCGLPTASASATVLGGNCRADLEERVAELEATITRKGSGNASLTVSGGITQQITFWDDGVERNALVTGLRNHFATYFKFTGQVQIAPGWSSGYVLSIAESIGGQQMRWFVQGDRLGTLSVGRQSHASDNAAMVDASGSLVTANWVLSEGARFFLRSRGNFIPKRPSAHLAWRDLAYCHHIGASLGGDCNGVPLNSVRYDSPGVHGFSFSASWGVDDFWDAAARYAGEWNSVEVAAAAAYSVQQDENIFAGPARVRDRDSEYFQAGLYLEHVATGLFVHGAYGHEASHHLTRIGHNIPGSDHWYLKSGVRRLWTLLGHTVLYGEYARHNDMLSEDLLDGFPHPRPPVTPASVFVADGSELERWGVGIVQEIDAAAMSLWVKYRNMDGEVEGLVTAADPSTGVKTKTRATADFDDIHFVGVGALINF